MSTVRPISNADLRALMKKGKVTFQYKKNDGTIRTATGTLNDSLITQKSRGGRNTTKDAGYSTYFDLEKRGWRAFWSASLLKVEQRYYTPEDMERLFPDGEVFATGKFPDNSDV